MADPESIPLETINEGETLAVRHDAAGVLGRQTSVIGERQTSVQIIVLLPNLTELPFDVDRHTPATELMDIIITTLKLNPSEARHVLSLWLSSPDLDLQLKPNHCPVVVAERWPFFLSKYATTSEKAVHTQKPQLVLRRNVYIDRSEDLQVTDVEILELLYAEARVNIVMGNYPCDRELVLKLAGIQLLMQYGEYNPDIHTTEFYKSTHSVLPLYIQSHKHSSDECCSVLSFYHKTAASDTFGRAKPGDILSESSFFSLYKAYIEAASQIPYYGDIQAELFPVTMHNESKSLISDLISSQYWNNHSALGIDVLAAANNHNQTMRLAYLTQSSQLPYYGSVFFVGFIERAHRRVLHNSWLTVSIAANTDGIFLIDMEKKEPILGICYSQLHWEFIDVCKCKEPNCEHEKEMVEGEAKKKFSQRIGRHSSSRTSIPSLLLQYPSTDNLDNQNDPLYNVVRVYTKAARLIDAFIENCQGMMMQKAITTPDVKPVNAPFQLMSAGGAGDVTDGAGSASLNQVNVLPSSRGLLERSMQGLVKSDRFMHQCFNKKGECLSTES